MSTLKTFSKQAKERLKSGFWDEKKARLNHEKEVAATLGIDAQTVVQQQRELITKEIYNAEEYAEELEFNEKVKKILESDDIVLNPLQLLADEGLMKKMSVEEKQRYLLKLAQKYRDAVERFGK